MSACRFLAITVRTEKIAPAWVGLVLSLIHAILSFLVQSNAPEGHSEVFRLNDSPAREILNRTARTVASQSAMDSMIFPATLLVISFLYI